MWTHTEVKDIRDKAEALRAYTRQRGESLEMQNKCAEIKIRAERRAGQLIKEGQDKGEIASPENNLKQYAPKLHEETSVNVPKTLNQLGIEKTQSHRWQTIADMPEEEFENHIEEIGYPPGPGRN